MTFSQLGKPLFSTRIIKGDLNPVFEEVAILPVDLNVVRLKEELSVQLWDSDRASAVRFVCSRLFGVAMFDIDRMAYRTI